MADQIQPGTPSSDEIDLGQLLRMIRNGFIAIFKAFLRFFVYLKRHVILLGALVFIGALIGFGLNQIVSKKLKTEVIVKPNFDSKDYLYDVVEEIGANIMAKDTSFFETLGIAIAELEGFQIAIEPIEEYNENEDTENDLKYLELLQNFQGEDFATEILKSELQKKTTLSHRINFFYKKAGTGAENSKKLMDYINSNTYFDELQQVFLENSKLRITQNQVLIEQIDNLISNYSDRIENNPDSTEGMIYLGGENGLNVPSLLSLKNRLISDIEQLKLEMVQQKSPVQIIYMGKPQEVKRTFLNQGILLVPTLLLFLFFLYSFVKYLNKKSNELLP